jgi:hypothetical protein
MSCFETPVVTSEPPSSASGGSPQRFYRRKAAAEYLLKKFGFGAAATLAKLAVTGGGPEYYKAGRMPLYSEDSLDAWALSKIGAPRHSTSAD